MGIVTLEGLKHMDSEVMRLHAFIDSAAYEATRGTGTVHGPVFTATRNVAQLTENWRRWQSLVTDNTITATAAVHERDDKHYKTSVKKDSQTIVQAKRTRRREKETVNWGPARESYREALIRLQLFRERVQNGSLH